MSKNFVEQRMKVEKDKNNIGIFNFTMVSWGLSSVNIRLR